MSVLSQTWLDVHIHTQMCVCKLYLEKLSHEIVCFAAVEEKREVEDAFACFDADCVGNESTRQLLLN